MTEAEVKKLIGEENWEKFGDWMTGQTCGLNPDGSTDFYEYDVHRFAAAIKRGKVPIIYD